MDPNFDFHLLIAANLLLITFLLLDLWLSSHDPYQHDHFPHISEDENIVLRFSDGDEASPQRAKSKSEDRTNYSDPKPERSSRRMAQADESIGQESPALAAVAAEYQGWGGLDTPHDDRSDHPKEMIVEQAGPDPDFSFRDRRANRQIMGAQGGTFAGDLAPIAMAGYQEEAMAGHYSPPWGDPSPMPLVTPPDVGGGESQRGPELSSTRGRAEPTDPSQGGFGYD